MSGHSKWSNIKNRKGALDAKKSKIFGQLSKLIRIAVKEGKSGDPQHNSNLRAVLEKARAQNMPKDKVQRAIDCGLGKSESGRELLQITYEAFGQFGEAYLIEAITDNPNRTSGEVRFILSKHNASLAGPGSAKFLFERTQDHVYQPKIPMVLTDEQMTMVQELAEELLNNEDVEEIYCSTGGVN